MIRSLTLADEAHSAYTSSKEFTYDHVFRHKVVTFKKDKDTRLNIKVEAQRRSIKAICLENHALREPVGLGKNVRGQTGELLKLLSAVSYQAMIQNHTKLRAGRSSFLGLAGRCGFFRRCTPVSRSRGIRLLSTRAYSLLLQGSGFLAFARD